MSTERAALIRAVRADPGCCASRLVFADWLEEHNDPLADYVRAECAVLTAKPGSPKWRGAINRLIALTEGAGRPLGGWEYAGEIRRLGKWVAERREWYREGEEVDEYPPVP